MEIVEHYSQLLGVSTPHDDCKERTLGRQIQSFTLLFEAFSLRVLQAARSVEETRKLLGLNWHQVEAIKSRAVQRRLA